MTFLSTINSEINWYLQHKGFIVSEQGYLFIGVYFLGGQTIFPSIPIGRNSRHYQVMFGSGALMRFIFHNSHKQGAVHNPHVEKG